MKLLFDILCTVLISSVFVIEYIKTKRLYTLLGIPFVFYFFVIMPLLERLNINETFILIITLVIAGLTLVYAYKGLQITKKHN